MKKIPTMSKCEAFKKMISKSMPGLECNKCQKIVHQNTKCTGLTNKKIAALKAATSLEWTCIVDSQRESPRRNSSIIILADSEEEDGTTVQINAKKL